MRLAGGTPVTLAVVEGRWAILMDDGPVLHGFLGRGRAARPIAAALAGCPLTCHDAKSPAARDPGGDRRPRATTR